MSGAVVDLAAYRARRLRQQVLRVQGVELHREGDTLVVTMQPSKIARIAYIRIELQIPEVFP